MVGSVIGALFGLIYLWTGAPVFSYPFAEILRLLAVAAVVGSPGLFWKQRGQTEVSPHHQDRPPIRFGRGYWLVVGEALAIFGGAAVINHGLNAPRAVLPWITLVVGTHFFALAAVWRVRFFHWFGAGMTTSAAAGLIGAAMGLGPPWITGFGGIVPGSMLLAASYHHPAANGGGKGKSRD